MLRLAFFPESCTEELLNKEVAKCLDVEFALRTLESIQSAYFQISEKILT